MFSLGEQIEGGYGRQKISLFQTLPASSQADTVQNTSYNRRHPQLQNPDEQ